MPVQWKLEFSDLSPKQRTCGCTLCEFSMTIRIRPKFCCRYTSGTFCYCNMRRNNWIMLAPPRIYPWNVRMFSRCEKRLNDGVVQTITFSESPLTGVMIWTEPIFSNKSLKSQLVHWTPQSQWTSKPAKDRHRHSAFLNACIIYQQSRHPVKSLQTTTLENKSVKTAR